MQLLIIELELLKNNLAFLKAQNEITSEILNIINEANKLRNINNKPSLFNTIIKYFKELLLCKK